MANIEERLIELINIASVEVDGNKKVECLYQIKELALNHGLIEKFFQDILAFQNDRATNVKKFILAFIEAACKHDCQLCPRAILSLNLLLNDTNNEIIKRSIQVATQFYRALVQWIVKSQSVVVKVEGGGATNVSVLPVTASGTNDSNDLSSDIEKTWLMWLQIKNFTCALLESTNNDGVRTHCIKFIETIVLMQTSSDKYTEQGHELNLVDPMITPIVLSAEASMCNLNGLPKNGVLFDRDHKLELVANARDRFEQLVKFHGTSHISSVNLMATMQSLVVLARQRYRLFMGQVIQAMETLNNRLPPTLTESQVQSVRKFLKLQLTVMLKHPYSLDRFQLQITQLLQSVGSKQPEIHKVINDFKHKFGCDTQATNNNASQDMQKRIKLEPGVKLPSQQPVISSQGSQPLGKSKHLDLNKLTQELDEKEKHKIVVDAVKRILGDEKRVQISPAQMEIKKKVLSTLAYEFSDTECPQIIQDYIFSDLRNRHEICYAIIRKNYDIAAAKAVKRQINLEDSPELLKKFYDCFNSYLHHAQGLEDPKDKDIILPKLYELKEEYYSLSNQDEEEAVGKE